MKKALYAILIFFAGCASLQPPPTEKIAHLPVIHVGSPPPQDGEYIVLYPAGFAIPVTLKASGTMFAAESKTESHVILAKNLYLYKYWASHDGKAWKNSHELLGVEFGGGFDINGLQSNLILNAK
ncbi:MAG: hypothetical protein PHH36_07030 [Sideroxydans sp.]|nr:hypothetical protein [Sideroxydans sp.]